jgi:membrane protein implicated in regulation of membrane protease activity
MLGPLIACIAAAVLVRLFERKMPAFHDVVKPVYFVIGAALVVFIGRALRRRTESRRKGDRRRSERRHDQ